jgi:plastocyanin
VNSRVLLAGCAVGALLMTPAVSSAKTKSVSMGVPGKAQKAFRSNTGDANDFFPHTVAIHAGDTVAFVPNGFHTIDFVPKNKKTLNLFVPGAPVSGAKDAAGADFWFNGLPAQDFNPLVFAPPGAWGKSFTYRPSRRIESGAPLGEKLKPVKVKFPRTGTITYYCDIHPGMTGVVKVVRRSATVPSARADAKTVAAQVKRDLSLLKTVNTFSPGSGVIQIGGAGKHGVESYNFFPKSPTVKAGTTITFRMPTKSTEPHTATTGPGNPESEPNSYLGKLADSFNGPAPDPAAVYPSDQPGGTPASLTPTLHGNGFWNSGVLDSVVGSPLPASNQVTFAAPGAYTFHCMIHPFMKVTVNVTP